MYGVYIIFPCVYLIYDKKFITTRTVVLVIPFSKSTLLPSLTMLPRKMSKHMHMHTFYGSLKRCYYLTSQ